MINLKSQDEIELMKKGGKILALAMQQMLKAARADVSGEDLEKIANQVILKNNALPGFKKVKGYNHATCISVNDQIVHGIPNKVSFKDGDMVCIDCGVFYKGLNTDMSETLVIGNSNKEKDCFLETGRIALSKAIEQAVAGNRIGDISKVIQDTVEAKGFSVIRALIGHGVGKKLHEDPEIPGYITGSKRTTPLLKEGMTLAIEVIYSMGKPDVTYAEDGWAIKTKDKSLSAVFEKTVAITKDGTIVLT